MYLWLLLVANVNFLIRALKIQTIDSQKEYFFLPVVFINFIIYASGQKIIEPRQGDKTPQKWLQNGNIKLYHLEKSPWLVPVLSLARDPCDQYIAIQ